MPNDDAKYLMAEHSAAWGEISARIQARERLWISFVTVAFSIVGFAGSVNGYKFLGIVPGYLALATACFSRHHDMILRVLAEFQGKVEEKVCGEPHWVTGGWSDKASQERRWRDWAQLGIVFVATLSGLLLAYSEDLGFLKYGLFFGSLFSSLISFGVLLKTHWDRRRPITK